MQNDLAQLYDGNPLIRGISHTAGAAASDEPFVPLFPDAAVSSGELETVNQLLQMVGGGYSDAAERLTLRASIADYSQIGRRRRSTSPSIASSGSTAAKRSVT